MRAKIEYGIPVSLFSKKENTMRSSVYRNAAAPPASASAPAPAPAPVPQPILDVLQLDPSATMDDVVAAIAALRQAAGAQGVSAASRIRAGVVDRRQALGQLSAREAMRCKQSGADPSAYVAMKAAIRARSGRPGRQ